MKKAPPVLPTLDDDSGLLAEFLTHLVATVNPAIKKDRTYELLLEMFEYPMEADTAIFYGELIRATVNQKEETKH